MGKLFLFSIFLMFWGECFSLEEDLSQTDKAPWKPLIECDDYLFSIGKFLSPKSYIKYCLLSKREGALLTQGILSKIVFRYDKKWVQSFFRPCIKDSNEDWSLLLQNCSKILNCGNQLEVRCDKSLENPKIPKEFIHFINTAHHFNTFFLQGYDDHIDLMAVIKEIKRKNVFFKVFVDFKNVKSHSDFLDAFKDNFIIRAGISY
ncbi:MAG TPA: hypothetical protein VI959_04390, partial [Alphaproteobacteria bacterium]|nr:hypothetical protein [Alphaproteobacteria bacterium]